jgi:hypothetical protein
MSLIISGSGKAQDEASAKECPQSCSSLEERDQTFRSMLQEPQGIYDRVA